MAKRYAGNIEVPDAGPIDAKLVFVGEAPGETEEELRRPFVGMSGNLWKKWLSIARINVDGVYVTNVYPYRPAYNDINTVACKELHEKWISALIERLYKLTHPIIIVPCGNWACYAVTGKGKVRGAGKRNREENVGITKLRGSIFPFNPPIERASASATWTRTVKVIPTLHPAAVLRQMKWEKRTINDWKKIAYQLTFEGIAEVPRKVYIDPTMNELKSLFDAIDNGSPIAIDVETWGKTLSCVGFATSPFEAFVLPTALKKERERWLPVVKRICESNAPKILQNGLFDAYWFGVYNIRLNNYLYDTLAMHHCLDPAEDHDLAFLGSLYTSQPYWKDEAKNAEEVMKYASDRDAVLHYNAIDCYVTYEVYLVLLAELNRLSMLEFYLKHYQSMFEPLLDCMLTGIRCDIDEQKKWAKRLEAECNDIRKKLKEIAGEELYAVDYKSYYRDPTEEELKKLYPTGDTFNDKTIDKKYAKEIGYVMTRRQVRAKKEVLKKDFSTTKLKKFFFTTLNIPTQYKITKTEKGKQYSETLDKTALLKIAIKYKRAEEPARLLIAHRRKAKVITFLKAGKDKDGRIRCRYKLDTEAGRLASTKNPLGGGANLQNQDKEIRHTYLPDEGCVWLAFDGSQVEDRICKMLTGADRMREIANRRPDEFDAHQWMADRIGTSRYNAKRVTHAAQRGMHGKKLAELFLREDELVISASTCQKYIDAYLEEYWEIPKLYFAWIRELLRLHNKRLSNIFGRVIDFGTERFNDDLYRRAYSWPLQSTCVDWLNTKGFVPLYRWLQENNMKSRIITQEHDGFGVSAYLEEAWSIAQIVVESLEKPIYLPGAPLVIPVTVTIGPSWAGENDPKKVGKEFKRLPERDEFEEVVKRCIVT